MICFRGSLPDYSKRFQNRGDRPAVSLISRRVPSRWLASNLYQILAEITRFEQFYRRTLRGTIQICRTKFVNQDRIINLVVRLALSQETGESGQACMFVGLKPINPDCLIFGSQELIALF